jgi:hypothetical protein
VIAFERGEFTRAADIAARGRPLAHPAQRARLAAYEAKAHAASGRETAARDALDEMRAQSRVATRWTDGDQVIFAAVTFADLRDWAPAADLAQQYVTGGDNDRQGVGWAHATTGLCLIAGDRPDPAAAAHAGILALDATVGPDMSVLRRATRLHTELARRWPDVVDVAVLGDAITTARAALPDGSVRSIGSIGSIGSVRSVRSVSTRKTLPPTQGA